MAPTYEEIKAKDARRSAAHKASYQNFFQVLFMHIDGTVLKAIIKDPMAWSMLVVYVVVRIFEDHDELESPPITRGDIALIGGFLSFFLVFYVNQNFGRYFKLWGLIMVTQGRLFDVGILLGSLLPFERAHRINRFFNAAHVAGYTGLSDVYEKDNFVVPLVKATGMLTQNEMERLNKVNLDAGGSAARELFSWCLMDITVCKRGGLLDSQEANLLRTKILEARGAIGGMYERIMIPVPFFYIHFVCLLTFIYLPLFAIASAYDAGAKDELSSDILSGLIVFLQCLFLIGLRILGERMSDPFGNDLVDFPIHAAVIDGWKSSNRSMESALIQQPASLAQEVYLKKQREMSIGDAWTHYDRPTVYHDLK